ncbi:hypothetical protein [Leptolyngbya sp. 7M]|uniref:hypothetical protein n=1 Tax=Leptolyngbya sp. 7M TaxID=2812896 RepID=UPI001B8C5409|nr:hypothetical protein [Leptolyngbya sp. 7M]QYO67063.1 hypothetical protein JVX88_09780 [Leptolyngbya sp. 7M]
MKEQNYESYSERGSAGVKFLAVFLLIVLVANAGYNYIPVAYDGASFKQEMDVAVVKGLAASGNIKPLEAVKATIQKAAYDYNVPSDAFIEIKPAGGYIQAHVVYSKPVSILPFGIYTYTYNFDYRAVPSGYLTKQ